MPKISKSHAAIFLIFLTLVLLAVFFWRKTELQTPASVTEQRQKVEQNTAIEADSDSQEVVRTTTKSKKAIATYQLPTYDIPFDEVIEELKLASDGGDARANCRLSIELMRCQTILAMDRKKILDYLSQPVLKDASDESNASHEKYNYEESKLFLSCLKMDEEDLLKTQNRLEKAAQQKQADAMVLWASGEWIKARYGRSDAYLQDPAYARWRVSAIPTMIEALHLGSSGAALEWRIAYSDTNPPNANLFYGLVKNDLKLAYTFSVLIRLLENSRFPYIPPPGLSTADALAAEQNARQMFEKWFDGRPTKKGLSSFSYLLRNLQGEDCAATLK